MYDNTKSPLNNPQTWQFSQYQSQQPTTQPTTQSSFKSAPAQSNSTPGSANNPQGQTPTNWADHLDQELQDAYQNASKYAAGTPERTSAENTISALLAIKKGRGSGGSKNSSSGTKIADRMGVASQSSVNRDDAIGAARDAEGIKDPNIKFRINQGIDNEQKALNHQQFLDRQKQAQDSQTQAGYENWIRQGAPEGNGTTMENYLAMKLRRTQNNHNDLKNNPPPAQHEQVAPPAQEPQRQSEPKASSAEITQSQLSQMLISGHITPEQYKKGMADPFSQGPMIQRIYDEYVKKYNVNTNSPSTSSQNNGTGPSTVDQRPPY